MLTPLASAIAKLFVLEIRYRYQEALVEMGANKMPQACQSCGWQKGCDAVNLGSSPIHRYKNGKTDQKSVFCQSLQSLFMDAAHYMVDHGLAMEQLQAVLHHVAPTE